MTRQAEPGDFIDADHFDPEVLAAAEAAQQRAEAAPLQNAKALLAARARAYKAVFTEGKRTQDEIDIVLIDLMWFCKMWIPSYDIRDGEHASELAKRKDGRREVFTRIKDFTRLDPDALLMKYTDATTK